MAEAEEKEPSGPFLSFFFFFFVFMEVSGLPNLSHTFSWRLDFAADIPTTVLFFPLSFLRSFARVCACVRAFQYAHS